MPSITVGQRDDGSPKIATVIKIQSQLGRPSEDLWCQVAFSWQLGPTVAHPPTRLPKPTHALAYTISYSSLLSAFNGKNKKESYKLQTAADIFAVESDDSILLLLQFLGALSFRSLLSLIAPAIFSRYGKDSFFASDLEFLGLFLGFLNWMQLGFFRDRGLLFVVN